MGVESARSLLEKCRTDLGPVFGLVRKTAEDLACDHLSLAINGRRFR